MISFFQSKIYPKIYPEQKIENNSKLYPIYLILPSDKLDI